MRRAFILMFMLSLLQGALAWAALDSAPFDFASGATQARLAERSLAASTATPPAVYTISQSTLDSGTIVREYMDTNNVLFAISWKGPTLPDLRMLLGDKFTVMTNNAIQRPKAGQAQPAADRCDAVIASCTHMHAYAGQAWIPSALPADFDTSTME